MKSKAKVCRHTNDVYDTLIVELNGARLGVVVDRRTFKEESRDIVFQLDTYAALHNITPDEQADSEVSPPPDTPEPGPVHERGCGEALLKNRPCGEASWVSAGLASGKRVWCG